jgi:hypothetical protein
MKLDDQSIYNVTGWFPTSINPVHIGFYQVHTPKWCRNNYSFWNGKYWETCMIDAHHSVFRTKSSDMYTTGVFWRGLKYKVI